MIKTYNIDWDKVLTIDDIKLILSVLVDKVVIDFEKQSDLDIYGKMRRLLVNGNI